MGDEVPLYEKTNKQAMNSTTVTGEDFDIVAILTAVNLLKGSKT